MIGKDEVTPSESFAKVGLDEGNCLCVPFVIAN